MFLQSNIEKKYITEASGVESRSVDYEENGLAHVAMSEGSGMFWHAVAGHHQGQTESWLCCVLR